MKFLQCMASVAAGLSLTGPAWAGGAVGDFNFNETTGLINIPVARVAPAGSVQLAIGIHDIGNGNAASSLDIDEFGVGTDGNGRIIAGLPGRVEVSIMPLHGGYFRNNHYVFGVKWLAVPDAPDHPAFAVGVQSLNSDAPESPAVPARKQNDPAHFDVPSFFGVVSHSLPLNDSGMALDLHAGLGTGRLRNGFAGGEFHLNPVVSVLGETDGTVQSAGLRFQPSRRFEIMTVAQFGHPDYTRYGVQFAYRFGPTEEPDHTAEDYEANLVEPQKYEVRTVTPDQLPPVQVATPTPGPEPVTSTGPDVLTVASSPDSGGTTVGSDSDKVEIVDTTLAEPATARRDRGVQSMPMRKRERVRALPMRTGTTR
ncbi:MAG: hypothetical protein AB1758_00200 [Candidatus Eremiobacterota bacterium]